MIALMPKVELIELAEALVSITAIERKATSDEGTVGGPVDVAFISKHEGFVWIKRKHYFKPDLQSALLLAQISTDSKGVGTMTGSPTTKRRRGRKAEVSRGDDLDDRLNRIVGRSAKEAVEKAKAATREGTNF